MKTFTSILALAAVTLAFPANAEEAADKATAAPAAPNATAEILGADGNVIGKATFQQGTIGVLLNVDVANLPPGSHGMHLHAIGTCEPMEHFKTASGHINPEDKKHGFLNSEGPDKGDLPNLIVHEDGTAKVELFLPQVNVAGDGAILLDEDGTSLMIHAQPDDHTTQPIGGSGDRIACGVVAANP